VHQIEPYTPVFTRIVTACSLVAGVHLEVGAVSARWISSVRSRSFHRRLAPVGAKNMANLMSVRAVEPVEGAGDGNDVDRCIRKRDLLRGPVADLDAKFLDL
jgi:hypothetical protein